MNEGIRTVQGDVKMANERKCVQVRMTGEKMIPGQIDRG